MGGGGGAELKEGFILGIYYLSIGFLVGALLIGIRVGLRVGALVGGLRVGRELGIRVVGFRVGARDVGRCVVGDAVLLVVG